MEVFKIVDFILAEIIEEVIGSPGTHCKVHPVGFLGDELEGPRGAQSADV